MKGFFQKANEKLNDMLNDEASILSKTKESLANKGVSIPVTSDMLIRLVEKQVNQVEKIYNLNIAFQEDFIRFRGTTKKLLVDIPFEIDLKPLKAEKRALSFTIKNMKPLNQDWIKNKIFNKPPLLEYKEGIVKIDLNQFERVQAIPLGNIQHYEIRDRKLWVKIGL